jgi:hypothetical protein
MEEFDLLGKMVDWSLINPQFEFCLTKPPFLKCNKGKG